MASASTNLTGAVRVVQVLKIDGYSATTTMDSIKSRWNVDGYEWEIQLYPATSSFGVGYNYDEPVFRKSHKNKFFQGEWSWEKRAKWVAMKLVFVGDRPSSTIRATLGCRLVDQRGVLSPSQEKIVSRGFCSSECNAVVVLIESNDLAGSGYLSGDSLAVECAITVLRELPVPSIPAGDQVISLPSSNLHQHLGELLRTGTGADVTFVVSGESFTAHKLILASRSPVFMAEFFGAMREKGCKRVKIKGMDAAAFGAMLRFIYTDTVPELDQDVDGVATVAQHLLAAADRYGLDRLKLICEIKLSHGVTVDTAATTLALAEQHNCSQLKARCVEFIVGTTAIFDAVLATEGYKHLEESCPLVLTELLKSVHGRKSMKRRRS